MVKRLRRFQIVLLSLVVAFVISRNVYGLERVCADIRDINAILDEIDVTNFYYREDLTNQVLNCVMKMSPVEIGAVSNDEMNKIVDRLSGLLYDDYPRIYILITLRHLGNRAKLSVPALLDLLRREEKAEMEKPTLNGPNMVPLIRQVLERIDPYSVPPCQEQIQERFSEIECKTALQ